MAFACTSALEAFSSTSALVSNPSLTSQPTASPWSSVCADVVRVVQATLHHAVPLQMSVSVLVTLSNLVADGITEALVAQQGSCRCFVVAVCVCMLSGHLSNYRLSTTYACACGFAQILLYRLLFRGSCPTTPQIWMHQSALFFSN